SLSFGSSDGSEDSSTSYSLSFGSSEGSEDSSTSYSLSFGSSDGSEDSSTSYSLSFGSSEGSEDSSTSYSLSFGSSEGSEDSSDSDGSSEGSSESYGSSEISESYSSIYIGCTDDEDCKPELDCIYYACIAGQCEYDNFCESSSSDYSYSSESSSSYSSSRRSYSNRSYSYSSRSRGIDDPIVCGDGFVEGAEECDIGSNNVPPGTINGFCACDPKLSTCVPATAGINWKGCRWSSCGDGIINNDIVWRRTRVNYDLVEEECDDGNTLNGDGCNQNCKKETTTVASDGLCGDGIIHDDEQCDDGNRIAGDGCSANCTIERGYCGDGVLQPGLGEQCEPSIHSDLLPYECSASCRYVSSYCGDSALDPGEQCDEGHDNSNSPSSTCRADCSLPRCGDSILDSNEECDDGNRQPSDGCDNLCKVERSAAPRVDGQQIEGVDIPFSPLPGQVVPFPNYASPDALPYDLPYDYLKPYAQGQAPAGDTGPAALVVMLGGAAAGTAWARRKKRK
ncbi:DUF4215 domain-containing protein, partial [Candidatus Peregrinibacteria bacterium]|nr:DUF4215 domain-containing protein [Candidatus Peregrinibacteria bacterium]